MTDGKKLDILWRQTEQLEWYNQSFSRLQRGSAKLPPVDWSRVQCPTGEGQRHNYKMRRMMKSGLPLKLALERQRNHVMERGETLEGYLAHFKPQTITEHARIRSMWAADTEFLNLLVRVSLAEYVGHDVGDINVILRNRSFFEKVRTKGVTK